MNAAITLLLPFKCTELIFLQNFIKCLLICELEIRFLYALNMYWKVVITVLVALIAWLSYIDLPMGMLATGFENARQNRHIMAAFAERLYGDTGSVWLKDKTVLVTGTSSGLGEGIAAHLYEAAPASTTLVLPMRNVAKHNVDSVRKRLAAYGPELRKEFGGEGSSSDEHPKIVVVQQDLSDLASIAASIDALAAHDISTIDILINNAGLIAHAGDLTKQGFDLTMGVNHFGTAYLTLELQKRGLLSAGAENSATRGRLVMVSSEEHRLSERRLDDPEQPEFGVAQPASVGTALLR